LVTPAPASPPIRAWELLEGSPDAVAEMTGLMPMVRELEARLADDAE
jgi:hypothetical protein